MKTKKFVLFIVILVLISLISCNNKVADESRSNTDKQEKNFYTVRNDHTGSIMILNNKCEILVRTEKPGDGNYVSLVNDEYSNEPMCIFKTIIGEKKLVEEYEYDGVTNSYDTPSMRVELYDLNGNILPFNTSATYINFGCGEYVYYFDRDSQKMSAYNIKTEEIKHFESDFIQSFMGNIVMSNNNSNESERKIEIYDKELNHIKTINGYSYDWGFDVGKAKYVRLLYNPVNSNVNKYNFLDENLKLLFDEPISNNIYVSDKEDTVLKCVQGNKEFMFDFEAKKIVGDVKIIASVSEIYDENGFLKEKQFTFEDQKEILKKLSLENKDYYVSRNIHNGKIIYHINCSYYDGEKYIDKGLLYDANLNLCDKNIESVQNVYDEEGLIFVNYDTVLDFDFNVVKIFEEKGRWEKIEKFDKKFYCDRYDTEYRNKENFNLYDDNFNIIFTNIKNINAQTSKDYIIIEDENSTKLYDANFNIVKDLKKHYNIHSWNDGVDDKHIFVDNETKLEGIMDKDFNILIEGLKSAKELKENYFTFQKGFRYGLMDYEGKEITSFSIFDDTSDEDKQVKEYDYYEEVNEEKDISNYPIVDGSTANIPMMAEIRSEYLGEEKEISENSIKVTTTDYAWRNLLEGKNDLLLVYEPSSETKKIIEESDVKLKITPIGVDALVFIANENNPINDISTKNLQDIYEGKITNWNELGGEDKKIEAYQRPLNSGSQTLFLNLLMKGKTAVDAPKSYRMQGMDDLIEVIASYNNSANALGYSVFYYAKKMYEVPGLKLLSVDGVEPNDETIASKKYPYLNEYYLVIREDTEEDSETMKLYNFILSDKGKEAIKKAGYIPIY